MTESGKKMEGGTMDRRPPSSSKLVFGRLPKTRRLQQPRPAAPRLIAVIELTDRQTGEIVEQIQVDVSEAPLPDSWLRIMLRNGGSESVTKHLRSYAKVDAATAEALQRASRSEHKWTGCYFDPKSAIAWCEHKGIDLDR